MSTLLFLSWPIMITLVTYISIKGPERLAAHIVGEY
jgi:hypothetical protein